MINVVGSKEPVVPDGLKALKSADLLTAISTNVVTTHVMISQMLALLEKGREKRVINISTTVGSMALVSTFECKMRPCMISLPESTIRVL